MAVRCLWKSEHEAKERVMFGGFITNLNHIMDDLDNVGKLFSFPPLFYTH